MTVGTYTVRFADLDLERNPLVVLSDILFHHFDGLQFCVGKDGSVAEDNLVVAPDQTVFCAFDGVCWRMYSGDMRPTHTVDGDLVYDFDKIENIAPKYPHNDAQTALRILAARYAKWFYSHPVNKKEEG